VLNASLATVPKAAVDLYSKALESSAAGNTEQAIEQLKGALSQYPNFPLALNELGVQYLKIRQPDKAAESLAAAVRLAPQDFQPQLNYGIALLNQRKFTQAEDHLRVALQKNDSIPTAHMYLGITLLGQKRLDDAEKELKVAAVSPSAEVAQAHRFLGGIYWARRDYKRAVESLENYLRLDPKAPDAEKTRLTIKELKNK
jgi:Tfp pilus assembly protein PilF